MALEMEQKLYQANLDEWRKSRVGLYVVIHREEILGFFDSLDEAFQAGSKAYGLEDFFVKQIRPSDNVNISFLGRKAQAS